MHKKLYVILLHTCIILMAEIWKISSYYHLRRCMLKDSKKKKNSFVRRHRQMVPHLACSLAEHSVDEAHDGSLQINFISVTACWSVQVRHECLHTKYSSSTIIRLVCTDTRLFGCLVWLESLTWLYWHLLQTVDWTDTFSGSLQVSRASFKNIFYVYLLM